MTVTRDSTRIVASMHEGRGRPVVVVPGAVSDAAEWAPVADSLERPVVVMNRRGRAPSGPLGDGYDVRTEVDDLHAVLDELAIEVDLFGWSYGGLIAAETATERADVRSLVAYEPVAAPFAPDAVVPLQKAVADGDLDQALEIVNLQVSLYSRDQVERLRRTAAWSALKPLVVPAATEIAAINEHVPRRDAYAGLEIPVTLVVGERNLGQAPYGVAFDRFADAFPDARVELLPAQGHLAHAVAPELLAEHVQRAVAAA